MEIKIYATPTCPYCKITRSLQPRGVLRVGVINSGSANLW